MQGLSVGTKPRRPIEQRGGRGTPEQQTTIRA